MINIFQRILISKEKEPIFILSCLEIKNTEREKTMHRKEIKDIRCAFFLPLKLLMYKDGIRPNIIASKVKPGKKAPPVGKSVAANKSAPKEHTKEYKGPLYRHTIIRGTS